MLTIKILKQEGVGNLLTAMIEILAMFIESFKTRLEMVIIV
jgi:hypothetical protein